MFARTILTKPIVWIILTGEAAGVPMTITYRTFDDMMSSNIFTSFVVSQINIRQEEGLEGTTMAGVVLAEGLAVGDCIREYR